MEIVLVLIVMIIVYQLGYSSGKKVNFTKELSEILSIMPTNIEIHNTNNMWYAHMMVSGEFLGQHSDMQELIALVADKLQYHTLVVSECDG